MIAMPRSLQDIIDHADDLADWLERDARPVGERTDAAPLRNLASLVEQRGQTEAAIRNGVVSARDAGTSWAALGVVLGTSGEAVRQRYGQPHTTTTAASSSTRPSGRPGTESTTARREVNSVTTGKKDASAASKILRSKSASKATKSVAGSDLSQERKTKTVKKK